MKKNNYGVMYMKDTDSWAVCKAADRDLTVLMLEERYSTKEAAELVAKRWEKNDKEKK